MIETKLSYNPDFAVHPGETLKDELEFLKLSQVELSQRIGLSEKHISQIINGEDPITSETAIKLELALGIAATFWSNLQKNYELSRARIASEKRVVKEIKEAKKFNCYPELAKLGRVEKNRDWKIKTESLLKFFGVNSLNYIHKTEAIAFRQGSGKFDLRSLAAWLRCGELDAAKIETKKFNKKIVKDIIPEIKKLTLHPDGFGRKLQELCVSAGVAVVYTPHFKNTKVNGSARWFGDKAVIQLNTRGAFGDIFWFTFFHELGHILLHGVKEKFIDFSGKVMDVKEKEADEFSGETLIPSVEYNKFLKNKTLNKQNVESFAKDMGVDKGIVIGRLAHDGKADWSKISHLRSRLVINP